MDDHIADRREMGHETVFHGVGDGMAAANGLVAVDLDVNLNDMLDPHPPHPRVFRPPARRARLELPP